MKKIYTLIFASVFSLLSLNSNAAIINVTVASSTFTPNNFAALIGDQVVWTFTGGFSHSSTSTTATIPAGALAWDSGLMTSGTFSYTITTAGAYGYGCSLHAGTGMVAQFTVTATGIVEPLTDLLTNAYPNPFKDKITFKYNSIDIIEIMNVVGEKVKIIQASALETKVTVDFENLPSGIYFYRTLREGVIVETKKIVKAK